MTETPNADVVARQYEKWVYPEPIQNLEAWLADNWQWFDPSHAHRVLWPDKPYQPDMDVLIAGCGSNQAAVFAYTNRAAKVVAVDVSQSSLDHEKYLKDRYRLKNLELHLLPVEEVGTLNAHFDLAVSTGVIHHLADPLVGMRALADVLRPDGVAAIMLYARYGRAGVELMQAVFRELRLRQDEQSLEMVKSAVAGLAPTHPLHDYMTVAPDLAFDAGMVDTFLHGRDRSYTVDECLELVGAAGLVFQDWFFKTSYYPPTLTDPDNTFYAAVDALPDTRKWAVMERLKTVNACHFFLATTPQRSTRTYRIDFSSAQAPHYIPLMRQRCGLRGEEIHRPDWSLRLDPAHLAFVQYIDGERTVRQIAEKVAASGVSDPAEGGESELLALELFEGLWQMDFLAVDLSAACSGEGTG